MPLLPYDHPLRAASRKKKKKLKAKQFMTSDIAYKQQKSKKLKAKQFMTSDIAYTGKKKTKKKTKAVYSPGSGVPRKKGKPSLKTKSRRKTTKPKTGY